MKRAAVVCAFAVVSSVLSLGWGTRASAAPVPTFIDFDDTTAPCIFAETVAAREEYASRGVHFDGPAGGQGGAILNECGGWSVSDYSTPNILAFNDSVGYAVDPETITFDKKMKHVSALVASDGDAGQQISMTAFDKDDVQIDSDSLDLTASTQELEVEGKKIVRVVVDGPSVFVLDDLLACKSLKGCNPPL